MVGHHVEGGRGGAIGGPSTPLLSPQQSRPEEEKKGGGGGKKRVAKEGSFRFEKKEAQEVVGVGGSLTHRESRGRLVSACLLAASAQTEGEQEGNIQDCLFECLLE